MASLFDPVPTVNPQTNAAAGMNIQANPNAFGADVGRATSDLGQSIEKVGLTGMDALIAKQHLLNEVHASEANTWLADRITERYGEFSRLEGKAAVDALPQFKTDIDGLYTEHLATAPSLQERSMLARNGKQLTARYYGWAEQRASGQFRIWQDKTATDRAQSYGNVAGLAAANGDDAGMQVALNTSDDEVSKLFEQRGWGRKEIDVEVSKNRGRNLKQIIETQAVEDPVGAVERFRKVSDQMDPASRLSTANHLRPLVTKIHGREIADEVLGREPPGQPQGGRTQTIMQKFQDAGYTPEQSAAAAGHLFHESSNNPNAVHDGGIGIGIAGWNGERRAALERFAAQKGKPVNDFDTQVDFAIHELDTSESKAGAALKNAASIEDAATAFMHYERPRGYTPQNPRGGDSYDARLGNAIKFANGNFSAALPDKATTFQRIIDRTGQNPNLQDAALSWANRVYSSQQSSSAQASAAFKTRWNDTAQEAWRTGTVQQPLTRLDFMENFGPAEGAKNYREYQAQLQLGADVSAAATMSPEEQDKLLKTYEPQPGEGYADAAKRQDALSKVIQQVRTSRAKDPEFKARIEGSLGEAVRTGRTANPVSLAEFQGRFGVDEGTTAYNHYRASLRLGRDVQTITDLSFDEQNALLRSYEPEGAEDLGGQAKRQQELRKAIDAARKERDDDPAAYALTRLPAVRAAQAAMAQTLSDPRATPEERLAATRQYVNVTLAEQARVGVDPDARAILTKGQGEKLSMDLMKPTSGSREGEDSAAIAGNIEAQAKLWGENWPLVYKQIQKDAVPVVRVIGSGVAPLAARILTELAPLKLPDILKDENAEKASTIKKDVLDAFKPFGDSMVGSEDRIPIFNDFRSQAEKLAAYYVVGGKTSSEAADLAFKDLLGAKYHFPNAGRWFGAGQGTYRYPKSEPYPVSDIEVGAQQARGRLGEMGLLPARDTIGGLSARYLADAPVKAYQRDGVWVTAPGDSGLMLVYNDEAVRTKNGQPLTLTWKQIAEMGQAAVKDWTGAGAPAAAVLEGWGRP